MPPWSETTPGSRRTPPAIGAPSVPAITPQQPSSLAEAKARFAASWDLATLQLAEIEQVAVPSPPASWYCYRNGPILVTFGKFSEPARKAAIRPVHLRVTCRQNQQFDIFPPRPAAFDLAR